MKCPLCEGNGEWQNVFDDKESMIKEMRKRGLTIRQIQKATGFKSPSTIFYYLNRNKGGQR